jgi:hypothetical protein
VSRRLGTVFISTVVVVVVAIFVALISSVIWPGQVAHLAPLFCADPAPTGMVISDTFATDDGTSTNFTLYCVGARGQSVDAGWLQPFLVLWGVYSLLLGAIVTMSVLYAVLLRRRNRSTAPTLYQGTSYREW